jgi:putative component of membrane protein insertase Oxa1/YidC/SpoIIIJ protein YidD
MALSVVTLYRDVLPRTNCKDCGFQTCMAFAAAVVADRHPLAGCPHLSLETLARCQPELQAQYADKRWTRRDMQEDALVWARERAAKIGLDELPSRLGGDAAAGPDGKPAVRLSYWDGAVLITEKGILAEDGGRLSRLEETFLYNHVAMGGMRAPSGKWIGFEEIKNTVSKQKSMKSHVTAPLEKTFSGNPNLLHERAKALGGKNLTGEFSNADLAYLFLPLPRVPIMLLFWDAVKEDGMEASAKMLLDETITDHLDIESMLFLCEHLVERLGA